MNNDWVNDIQERIKRGEQSASITAENPTGARGAGGQTSSPLGPGRKGRPCITLPAGETTELANIDGAGTIRHIWMTVATHTEAVGFVLRDLVLRMYWDGSETPSVEVPLGDFFCNGNGERALVTSDLVVVAPTGGMNAYFTMPFRDGARITIENQHPVDVGGLFYQIDYLSSPDPETVADLRFHATWRRENPTTIGEDFTILDTVHGRGAFLGTYLNIVALERYWYGEGEVKFFIDGDAEYPTICGTGTEDYFGGAWAFQDRLSSETEPEVLTFSAPYCGYPTYSTNDTSQQAVYSTAMAPVHGMYRWHVQDPILFSENLRVTVQQIGQVGPDIVERSDDVAAVAYWYQTPLATDRTPIASRELRRPR
ncbi:glycoside hydrolase family 172 protein [Leifsonia sp. Le1]|uniref:glycoside hydrolase family 172 protein n=1 Tax=Leifsonia sp. Le1 TaxID=3404918 RepID=UPI003EBE761E